MKQNFRLLFHIYILEVIGPIWKGTSTIIWTIHRRQLANIYRNGWFFTLLLAFMFLKKIIAITSFLPQTFSFPFYILLTRTRYVWNVTWRNLTFDHKPILCRNMVCLVRAVEHYIYQLEVMELIWSQMMSVTISCDGNKLMHNQWCQEIY